VESSCLRARHGSANRTSGRMAGPGCGMCQDFLTLTDANGSILTLTDENQS
jgi:hypothetical protein